MDLGNKKTEKNGKKYECELCNFITSDKTDFTRHCATRKHKMETNGNNKNNNEGLELFFELFTNINSFLFRNLFILINNINK